VLAHSDSKAVFVEDRRPAWRKVRAVPLRLARPLNHVVVMGTPPVSKLDDELKRGEPPRAWPRPRRGGSGRKGATEAVGPDDILSSSSTPPAPTGPAEGLPAVARATYRSIHRWPPLKNKRAPTTATPA